VRSVVQQTVRHPAQLRREARTGDRNLGAEFLIHVLFVKQMYQTNTLDKTFLSSRQLHEVSGGGGNLHQRGPPHGDFQSIYKLIYKNIFR
jgi:hypothetical protein